MKKRLLFVIGMFAGGGAEKVLVNMVNQMDLQKYDITIYSVFDTGRHPNLQNGVKIYYSFKVGRDANNTIKQRNIKSVISNFLFTYGWKLLPMKLFYKWAIKDVYDYEIAYAEGIPHKIVAASANKNSVKYGWIHIDLTVHKRATEFFLCKREEINCYNRMNKLIFVSNYAKDRFVEKYGFKEKCIVKYNLNENALILRKSKEKLEDMPKRRPLLVTVGRLHEQKGYDRLLKCADKLRKAGYKFEIWIVGEGEKRKEFEEIIASKNLQDTIYLKGFHSNPYKYIYTCDWFIAPSRYEGYSTVVSEAFILGKPVMVTNCCGMSELTDNGKYGILVKNSVEGIEAGLKKILKMKDEEYEGYVRCAEKRGKFFDSAKRLEEVCELFEQE